MNEARSPSQPTITITHIRFVNRNGVYGTNNNNLESTSPLNFALTKAWCQTNEIDYCPLVISIMSFVIITSFLTIVYLCAKTSFQCPTLRCCSLLSKLRSSPSAPTSRHHHQQQQQQRRRRHRPGTQLPTSGSSSVFSLNTSTNYINDSVSLHSINQMDTASSGSQSVEAPQQQSSPQPPPPPPPPVSARARAIWWITGGVFGKQQASDPAAASHTLHLVAPPTYDESQQLHHMMSKSKRLQIVRKQPKQTATENAAFSMESSLSSRSSTQQSPNSSTSTTGQQQATSEGTAQFPSYRCLSLTSSSLLPSRVNNPAPTIRQQHVLMDESRCFQSSPSMRGLMAPAAALSSIDLDSMSMAFDEVPPPYEAVIVSESMSANRNASQQQQQRQTTQPIASFNSSLTARLANYSFRSSREFQI